MAGRFFRIRRLVGIVSNSRTEARAMQDEREEQVGEDEEVEAHLKESDEGRMIGHTEDDDEVEAHRWPQTGPAEPGKRF
jgi:hypothetical protein